MRRRAPVDGGGGRPSSYADLQVACRVVDRSGVVPVLTPLVDSEVGRRRTISVRALLVAAQLNALARHHNGHVVEVARVVNALSDEQRASLGITDYDPSQTYHRVDRLFNKLCDVLDAGHFVEGVRVDARWLANRLAGAAVPAEFRTSSSVAVDGTDVETWGALHGDAVSVDLDGEASQTQLVDDGATPKPRKPARRAQVLACAGRAPCTTSWPRRASTRPSSPSPTSGAPDRSRATPC